MEPLYIDRATKGRPRALPRRRARRVAHRAHEWSTFFGGIRLRRAAHSTPKLRALSDPARVLGALATLAHDLRTRLRVVKLGLSSASCATRLGRFGAFVE